MLEERLFFALEPTPEEGIEEGDRDGIGGHADRLYPCEVLTMIEVREEGANRTKRDRYLDISLRSII